LGQLPLGLENLPPPSPPNISIFYFGVKTILSGSGQKYPAQSWVNSLFTADQVRSRLISNHNLLIFLLFILLYGNNQTFFLQPKCDLYWPDAGSETYGDLVISLLREDILASYTLRTFSIRPMRIAGSKKPSLVSSASFERTVYQVKIDSGQKFLQLFFMIFIFSITSLHGLIMVFHSMPFHWCLLLEILQLPTLMMLAQL